MLAAEPGLVLVDRYEMRYEDWLGERFKRFQAGGFLIVPPWDPSPDGGHRRRITLDPGVVFGTGTHPTTRDCLEFVERVAGEPAVRTAVDVGTGTGLLALAAARAGCRKVLAFDVNLLAVRTARKNVLLNRLEDRVLAVQGSAHEMADAPADLMIANIHYDVMTGLVASGSLLNKRWLILSGLLRSQAADVLKALSDLPVEVMETRQQDGIWHTFLERFAADKRGFTFSGNHGGAGFPKRRVNMFIRCWGSRGSVPVSGKDYIRYGGDTTCVEIRNRTGDIIIVDAGTGIRRLGHHLTAEGRHEYHMIFTHAHWDHVMGFPFFKPIYSPQTRLRMYRCPYSKFVETMLSKVMAPPYFPVPYGETSARVTYAEDISCSVAFDIGSLSIESIPLSHPNTGMGYKFTEDGKSFVFLTDNELHFQHAGSVSYERYLKFAAGADLLMHDAEYTPEEYPARQRWGHSTYMDALNFALDAGVRKLGLFHLNQDRTDQEVDAIVATCRDIVARRGKTLACFAVGTDMEFEL